MLSPRRVVSEIRRNGASLGWWRDRVFVPFVVGPLTRLHPSYPGYVEATHVMHGDWDNLFVLDACRADAFEETVETKRFDEYRRAISLGSHSSEWTRKNFQGQSFPDTVYVSANPHTTLLAGDTFHELVEVWTEFECSPNQIDPSEMAATARETLAANPEKRLIVHFMQPHGTGGLVKHRGSAAATYRATIPAITDIVEDLAADLGGRTAITADHGELFSSGMKRRLGINQHKARLRYPELVTVPWAVLDGDRRPINTGSATESGTDLDDDVVRERLRDLGYHA